MVGTIECIGEGWDHVAFLVNDELVFRLPGPDAEVASPATEVSLLRAVAGRLPVEVPEPMHVTDDYFGYRHLPGGSLEDADEVPANFADLVIDVVVGLEQIVPVDRARAFGLPPAPDPATPTSDADAHLPDEVRTALRTAAGDLEQRWPAAMRSPLVTLHNDLGFDHWIVDGTGRPYALIDWSDACVGPPELQLSTLMWHASDLIADIAQRYVDRTGRAVDGRLVHACGFANAWGDLTELLADDEEDDEEDVEWCLDFLGRWSDPQVARTLQRLWQPT